MKERLTKLIKEAKERYIYAEEQAQYLIENSVDCVNHGEWVEGKTLEKCSVCGKKGFPDWHYCPNCGAKMDGATDNNVGDKGR